LEQLLRNVEQCGATLNKVGGKRLGEMLIDGEGCVGVKIVTKYVAQHPGDAGASRDLRVQEVDPI